MRILIVVAAVTVGVNAFALSEREAFLVQQAQAEMQRVAGQIDVLQSNFEDMQHRVGKLEGAGDLRGIRQEIDALKASIAELRREMSAQRDGIVKDLSSRIAKIPQAQPRPVETTVVYNGPHIEYTVAAGDTLSIIAQAFNTTVRKIKDMNGMKNDSIRIGQKLNIPKEGK